MRPETRDGQVVVPNGMTPAQYKRTNNRRHALRRARERYGCTLWQVPDIVALETRIRAGGPGIVPLRPSLKHPRRMLYAVEVGGRWLPLIYDNRTDSAMTFPPERVLDRYAALLVPVKRPGPKAPPSPSPAAPPSRQGPLILMTAPKWIDALFPDLAREGEGNGESLDTLQGLLEEIRRCGDRYTGVVKILTEMRGDDHRRRMLGHEQARLGARIAALRERRKSMFPLPCAATGGDPVVVLPSEGWDGIDRMFPGLPEEPADLGDGDSPSQGQLEDLIRRCIQRRDAVSEQIRTLPKKDPRRGILHAETLRINEKVAGLRALRRASEQGDAMQAVGIAPGMDPDKVLKLLVGVIGRDLKRGEAELPEWSRAVLRGAGCYLSLREEHPDIVFTEGR